MNNTYVSMDSIVINSIVSNVSSALLPEFPYAPTPLSNSSSLSGTVQTNDSARRCATNTKVLSSSAVGVNRLHVRSVRSESCIATFLTSTGENENQSPNADQKGVSFARLRILYEMMRMGPLPLCDRKGVVVRCNSVRRRGANSAGKYTCAQGTTTFD